MFIWERVDWPDWSYDLENLAGPLGKVRHHQGRFLGRMESLGFKLRDEALLTTLTQDVVKSSEIEGEHLNAAQVRSSIARRLGIDSVALIPSDRHVDGVVEMLLDATRNYAEPLTAERLFAWHGALFPTGRSGLNQILTATWRDDAKGPMQVISGPYGHEKIHYVAPPAERVPREMDRFLAWFNTENSGVDPVLKAGLAHFWFVTIHPFDDGNGRIARAIGDMALARSEQTAYRFYSLSAQIEAERRAYYDILERSQKGPMDVTAWLEWFLDCLGRALDRAELTMETVLQKARFWERHASRALNERHIMMLNRLLDGFEGKLTTTKWAKIAKCSQDTAYRDILQLVEYEILRKGEAGGRGTNYELAIE
ncbi:MAG: Fic family protein [Desulfuromonadales bacterium]